MISKEQDFSNIAHHTKNARNIGHTLLEPSDHYRHVKTYLCVYRQNEALELVKQSLVYCPDDPVLLSYYGCLLVLAERMYQKGIETCQKAIKLLLASDSRDDAELYSMLYYNLGKAYAAMGKRNDARKALNMALSYDPGNCDVIQELRRLGMRCIKPTIPFLHRSNPLNKFIGIILYKRKSILDYKKRVATP